jgi:S-DNA-T family DNA segregation ATPase FtsK/SpoIIIE
VTGPERDDEQGGEVVPFPGATGPAEDEQVVDAELVDETTEQDPNADIVLYDADRDDQAPAQQPADGPLPAPWQQQAPERRPVVAAWMRSAQQRRQAARWAVEHTAYLVAFHALRVPLYGLRLALLAPRGAGRIVFGLARWAIDAEGHPLRAAAVRREDHDTYLKLTRVQQDKVRGRRITLGVGLVLLAAAAVALQWAPWWAQVLAVMTALGTCAHAGRTPDRPLIDPALLSPRVRKLTPDILMRAFVAADLAREDNPISFASTPHRDGLGWRVVVDLPYGVTADKAMLRRGGIASGLDVDERQLFLNRVRGASGSARRIAVWVADTDPLAVPAGPSPLIRTGRVNFWEAWPLGLDERGNEVRLSLLWASLLIGAIPRSGKSFAARLVALAAALDPHVRLYVGDLKGSPDWVPLAKVAHRFWLGDVPDPETGIDPVRAMLDDLLELRAEVDHRYRTLRKLPTELAPEGKLTENLARDKRLGMPLVLVSIDEIQRAFEHRELGKELEEVLTDLVKVGPAVGVMIVCSTQKPDKTATPARFRDQFAVRFALRVTSWQVSDVILGAGAYSEGLDASRLAPENKGAGLLRGTGDADVAAGVVRTYFADGSDAEAICTRARALREGAGTLTGAALGEMPEAPVAYSVPADVLQVLGSDEKAHSDVICSRLAEQWPDRYASWQPEQLAAALKPHRIATKQVWAVGLDGTSANRKGVLRAELLAALDTPGGS